MLEEVVNVSLLDDAVAEDAVTPSSADIILQGPASRISTGVATITDAQAMLLCGFDQRHHPLTKRGFGDDGRPVCGGNSSSPLERICTVSVTAATSDGVAKAGSDYITKTETLSFSMPPPEEVLSKPFIVQATLT